MAFIVYAITSTSVVYIVLCQCLCFRCHASHHFGPDGVPNKAQCRHSKGVSRFFDSRPSFQQPFDNNNNNSNNNNNNKAFAIGLYG
ncbi:hypothetical protein Anas_03221 [Armadillidium nasatum]|uniref:Secreted protein n=1 Tax=Armadillidium nasatum TaxID=96803 RepID=A0A5N5ST49_9CRUS|nr:hypothetical protein Anas_03221 [Armadillidium nasatum]